MNKKIIVALMLLFLTFLTGCNSKAISKNLITEPKISQIAPVPEETKIKVDKIEIIDFHSNQRCFSCQTIEKFAKGTVEEFFQPEIRDGKISFQSINVEESQNKEIVQKYQARGSSLFINAIKNGKDNIEEDTQVWRLVKNETEFKKYLKNKIDNILK